MRARTTKKHASYGVITLHRGTGNFDNLFQSSVGGNSGMILAIHEAEVHDEGLGDDHVFAKRQLIEICLSPLQWAEVICSTSLGAGTPCTLQHIGGEMIEEPPADEAVAHRNARQFAEDLGELDTFARQAEARVEDILAKGAKMKATDRAALMEIFGKLTKVITDSGPFLVKQTEEALGRMVEEAKATITDHARHLQVPAGAVTVPALETGEPGDLIIEGENYGIQARRAVAAPLPELPDLGPREKETKPPEEYTRTELAESIAGHLKRIEKIRRERRMASYTTEAERCQDKGSTHGPDGGFFWSGAIPGNTTKRAVGVIYVTTHGATMISFAEAVSYLKALRGGYEGRHFELKKRGKL